jgi:hypothetical protein
MVVVSLGRCSGNISYNCTKAIRLYLADFLIIYIISILRIFNYLQITIQVLLQPPHTNHFHISPTLFSLTYKPVNIHICEQTSM